MQGSHNGAFSSGPRTESLPGRTLVPNSHRAINQPKGIGMDWKTGMLTPAQRPNHTRNGHRILVACLTSSDSVREDGQIRNIGPFMIRWYAIVNHHRVAGHSRLTTKNPLCLLQLWISSGTAKCSLGFWGSWLCDHSGVVTASHVTTRNWPSTQLGTHTSIE